MKTNYILMIILMSMLAWITGCKKEGCTDPNATNYDEKAKKDDGTCIEKESDESNKTDLSIHFHPKFGSETLTLGNEYELNGRKIKITTAQFYVSGISVDDGSHHKNTKTLNGDQGVYLLVEPTTHMYSIGQVDAGHYDGIKFHVGLDSTANYTTQPADYNNDHALGSANANMHWSWAPGYIFIKIEGTVDTTDIPNDTLDVSFLAHVGAGTVFNNSEILQMVALTDHFDAKAGGSHSFNIAVDYSKFLTGLDFTKSADRSTHTMNNKTMAKTIADNASSVFTIME